MSTRNQNSRSEITLENPMASALRTIVRTPFYGNNVVEIKSLAEAYYLAMESPGTIITDLPVHNPGFMGLPSDAKVLLFNDGSVTGRCAAARRIIGQQGVDPADLNKKVMDAVYDCRYQTLYHATCIIGLDEDFMLRAHLLIPEGEENILYNWMLNFQPLNAEYEKRYKQSRPIENEGDIYVFSDPQWKHPEHPLGLTYFDPEHNCAALLGMRYFGEHKKGTLTLGWAVAARHGFASCHGGQKEITRKDGSKYVLSVFGLSGSGKSSITHAKHNGKYGIKVLHDDAFVINIKDKYSVAMEPTYFDKTQDYPCASPDNTYLLTLQNCGATLDDEGKIVPVTQDLRNGNGRAIKSKLWSPNRVDKIDAEVNGICWIMKDPTLPPLLHIKKSDLGSLFGATLATKRSSAERLAKGVDPNALVIEPYANPFRTYALKMDYERFKALMDNGVDCYILNTGFFLDKKVKKEDTLAAVESIVDGSVSWKPFGDLKDIDYADIPGFEPPFDDAAYRSALKAALESRQSFVAALNDFNQLPEECQNIFADLAKQMK